MTETKKLQVFLCHAAADKPRVRALYLTLQKRGIAPWLDSEDLLPGQDWKTEIPKAIHNSDVIIVCLTKNSITKEGYVQSEIATALDKAREKPGAIFIIPAKLEECDTPERLSHFQWVDLHLEGGYARLLRSLKVRAEQLERASVQLSKVDEPHQTSSISVGQGVSGTIIQGDNNVINMLQDDATKQKPVRLQNNKLFNRLQRIFQLVKYSFAKRPLFSWSILFVLLALTVTFFIILQSNIGYWQSTANRIQTKLSTLINNGFNIIAPKIEFFQASPISIIGPGEVEFSWSVTGKWNRIQIANRDGIIADNLKPQGVETVRISQSGTYTLTAWNGALSSAKPLDITIKPARIPVGLNVTNIYPKSNHFLVDNKITVAVNMEDSIYVDQLSPSGVITVTDGTSTCSFTLPALSCDLVFKTAGDKNLWASYSGDDVYAPSTSSKYPPKTKIHVFSPTVILTPDFYLTDENGIKTGSPIDVTSHQFRMDENLYIEVAITPQNAVLPDDDRSKVILSVCTQTDYPNSCKSPLITTVDVTNGVGIAKILLPNFPGAGTYILRFDYYHDNNLLAFNTYTQSDIQVLKTAIYLTLPPSSPCSQLILVNAPCNISYANPTEAHIVFYIHKTVGNDYLDTIMPPPLAPKNNAYPLGQVYEVDEQGSPVRYFSCNIITRPLAQISNLYLREVYALDCIINITNKNRMRINYDYDNTMNPNYFMGDDSTNFKRKPFYLLPIGEIVIAVNRSDYSVGQIIPLTPNKDLQLIDVITRKTVTHTTGKITLSSNSENANDLFEVVPGSTCRASVDGKAIVNIDVDETCQILLKKAGIWDIQIYFSGDDTHPSAFTVIAGIKVEASKP